jgi:hypothetical protein
MRTFLFIVLMAPALLAQAPKPFQAQAASTVSYVAKGDEKTVEIHRGTCKIREDANQHSARDRWVWIGWL